MNPSTHVPDANDNATHAPIILACAGISVTLYVLFAFISHQGDPVGRVGPLLAVHGLLLILMWLGWRVAAGQARGLQIALVAALIFRIVTAASAPVLSDDIYRYVWDGRVQVAGIHPYAHAPDSELLRPLRDENWKRINHPELRTIYPPLSQMLFASLAWLGLGATGFKLVLGLFDFGVVLVLAGLLRSRGQAPHHVLLYAWNPLAVVETAGSGHIEPLGVLLILLAAGWIIGGRPVLSTIALAASIQVKLLPLVLAPDHLRRRGPRALLLLAGLVLALALPYAIGGPAFGAGLIDYAQRWEHNALVFSALREALEHLDTGERLKPVLAWLQGQLGATWIPWDWLYRHVWPPDLARGMVGVAALGWVLWLATRRALDPIDAAFLAIAGVIVLSPTVHPWYVLWVLPLAVLRGSLPWMLFAALVPLSYLAIDGEVSWRLRGLEYLAPLLLWSVRWMESQWASRKTP